MRPLNLLLFEATVTESATRQTRKNLMFKTLNQKRASVLLAISAPVVAMADTAGATAAITAAQTDALTVCGALLAMGIAVWGASYLRKKFFG
jgi:Inovirus Coat protein B